MYMIGYSKRLAMPMVALLAFSVVACGDDDAGSADTTAAAPETTTGGAPDTTGAATDTTEAAPTTTEDVGLFSQAAYDLLPDRIKESGEIRFVGPDNPPWMIVGSGDPTGGAVDLIAVLEEILGVETSITISADAGAARTGILADRYDVFLGPSGLNAERAAEFHGIAWETVGSRIIMKADDNSITTDTDLCGKTVAVVEGGHDADLMTKFSEAGCVAAGLPAIEILGLDSTTNSVLAVLSGRADVAGSTAPRSIEAVEQDPTLKLYRPDSEILSEEVLAGVLTLADLSPALFEAWKIVFSSGEYMRILEAYGLEEVAIDEPLLNFINQE